MQAKHPHYTLVKRFKSGCWECGEEHNWVNCPIVKRLNEEASQDKDKQ